MIYDVFVFNHLMLGSNVFQNNHCGKSQKGVSCGTAVAMLCRLHCVGLYLGSVPAAIAVAMLCRLHCVGHI